MITYDLQFYQTTVMSASAAKEGTDAVEYVANVVCEHMQLSGERGKLRSMLLDELRSVGCVTGMMKPALQAVTTHQTENETISNTALTARQLADLIHTPGRGMLSHAFPYSSHFSSITF